jgi:hypothetical protein
MLLFFVAERLYPTSSIDANPASLGEENATLNATEWVGLGVAVTLLGEYIAHRIGWIQIGIMRDAHSLNVKKATPQINSRVSISPFHPANRLDVTRYIVHITIYNDGDLVARNLEGEWKLTASAGIQGATDIIRENSLASFMPLPLEHQIVGNIDPNAVIQVDIKMNYLGLDDAPKHYQATYDYDFLSRRMLQRK